MPEVGDGGTSEDKSATSSMHDATENSFAVPGHFYKLCATKSDQSDVESYFISSKLSLLVVFAKLCFVTQNNYLQDIKVFWGFKI